MIEKRKQYDNGGHEYGKYPRQKILKEKKN